MANEPVEPGVPPASTARTGEEWTSDVWAAGDYERTAIQYLPMAARLVDDVEVDADDTVLDIGTGTGNVAITAARQGATVSGIDICGDLLETARSRAATLGHPDVAFDDGDAAQLPYPDDSFDVTVSALGHMYADPPSAAAEELIRVTRPGGRIGFTAWGPMSLYARMAGVALQHVPPSALPEYTEPPFLWGDPESVRDRLEPYVATLEIDTSELAYPTVSPAAWWKETKRKSGMFHQLISSLDPESLEDLEGDMLPVIGSGFDSKENAVQLSYLQTVATLPKA